MSGEDTEQREITNYSGTGTESSASESSASEKGQEEELPSPDDPAAFLKWLREDDGTTPRDAVDDLPELIQQVKNGGYGAFSAGKCITLILEDANPPVEYPELISVLDNQHVSPKPIIDHLLQMYPQDSAVLETEIDTEFLEHDDVSAGDRMEGYRALSRLPPDDRIYRKLRRTAKMFDGVVEVDERYPVGGFYKTYAMRCLKASLQHPDEAPQDCAKQAISEHPWAGMRLIAANPEQAAEAGLLSHLVDTLDGRSVPPEFYHGRLITVVTTAYMQASASESQQQIAEFLEAMLTAGVYPTRWETTMPSLIEFMKDGGGVGHCGGVLAEIIDTISDGAVDEGLWRDIEPIVRTVDRADSAQQVEDIGRLLEVLGVYPPPPQLRSLYGSADEDIDQAAKDVVATLRRQFRDETPALVPGGVEQLQTLSQKYSLVHRTGAITWESPSLSKVELSVINAVARVASVSMEESANQDRDVDGILIDLLRVSQEWFTKGDDSVQFVVPSYDSAWFEFAVLGAAFAQLVNPDGTVVLHTPATGGWGTKKDIKEALKDYAIVPEDDHTDIVPLLDLVPTSRINDGDITVETTGTTVGNNPPTLTLARDIDSLSEAPTDVILYNYLPGIDAVNAAQLEEWRGAQTGHSDNGDSQDDSDHSTKKQREIADQASLSKLVQIDDISHGELASKPPESSIHIEMYSIFSLQYAADRRQHIGPPTDLPAPVLVTPGADHGETTANNDSNAGKRRQEAVALTSEVSEVDLYAVQTQDEIGELLTNIETYTDQVSDQESERALRSFRYAIESLPVPVELHDAWIKDQLDQGNKWVPRRIHDRRNGIRDLADDAKFDAQLLDEAVTTIDSLLERLADTNPLSEELMAVLDEAAAEEKKIGILCAKKTYKDMLDRYLKERASDWVLGDDLLLLDEQTVRDQGPDDIDWLVTFAPLPPQTAIYYHHPAVTKTIVLGHAMGALESRVYGVDYKRRPYLPHHVDADLPELDVTVHGSTPDVSEDDEGLTDELYQSYLSVAAQSRDSDESRSETSGGISRYQVTFEDMDPVSLSNAHPMIVKSDEHLVSSGDFVLRSLSRIGRGDEMVLIEQEARRDLWEAFLREGWDDGDEDVDAEAAFLDAVELWYDAVSGGLEAHSDTDDPGDGIWDFARSVTPDVSVATDTIVDWARSVYRADSPSDLVFRSDLRIGPRHADGVEAVADLYGSDSMAENWHQVFTRIKAIRATHRQRGRVFWEWLAERACDGDLFDQPGVNRVTVTRCDEIT